MTLEKKVTFNRLTNAGVPGIYVIKILEHNSYVENEIEVVKNYLLRLCESYRLSYARAEYSNLINEIFSIQPIYDKTISLENGTSLRQIVVNVSEIKERNSSPFYQMQRGLVNENGIYQSDTIELSREIAFQITELGAIVNSKPIIFISPGCRLDLSVFNDCEKGVVLKLSVDREKQYNTNSIVKVNIDVYPSLVESINNVNKNTYRIETNNNAIGNMCFMKISNNRFGNSNFKFIYSDKLKAKVYDKMLIIYDGDKGEQLCQSLYPNLSRRGYSIISINQFSEAKDLYYSEGYDGRNNGKLTIRLLNKNRILNCDIRDTDDVFRGYVVYKVGKTNRKVQLEIVMTKSAQGVKPQTYSSLIIPISEDGSHTEVINHVNHCLDANDFYQDRTELKNCYHTTLDSNREDILSEWFKLCTKSMRQTDNGIVVAYNKMKKQLEEEYKEIGLYLSNYDFSKCNGIPKIVMDKKLQKECRKSLHIEPENIIINSINRKKLKKPIEVTQPTIHFMCRSHGDILLHKFPLKKYTNNKTNIVELNYNVMKGDAIHAKVENRR